MHTLLSRKDFCKAYDPSSQHFEHTPALTPENTCADWRDAGHDCGLHGVVSSDWNGACDDTLNSTSACHQLCCKRNAQIISLPCMPVHFASLRSWSSPYIRSRILQTNINRDLAQTCVSWSKKDPATNKCDAYDVFTPENLHPCGTDRECQHYCCRGLLHRTAHQTHSNRRRRRVTKMHLCMLYTGKGCHDWWVNGGWCHSDQGKVFDFGFKGFCGDECDKKCCKGTTTTTSRSVSSLCSVGACGHRAHTYRTKLR